MAYDATLFNRAVTALALELPEAVYRDAAPILRAAAEEIQRLKYALAEKDRDETERELVKMGRRIAGLENDAICSIRRDSDGDATLDIYIDAENNLSISVHSSGRISWAGCVNGSRNHNTVTNTVLGNYLFTLLGVALAQTEAEEEG